MTAELRDVELPQKRNKSFQFWRGEKVTKHAHKSDRNAIKIERKVFMKGSEKLLVCSCFNIKIHRTI